jgi:hypothetical protein
MDVDDHKAMPVHFKGNGTVSLTEQVVKLSRNSKKYQV